jgi:hypothetical protein
LNGVLGMASPETAKRPPAGEGRCYPESAISSCC